MTPEQAARFLDMKCEKSMQMDESAKFDQCAGVIREQEAEIARLRAENTIQSDFILACRKVAKEVTGGNCAFVDDDVLATINALRAEVGRLKAQDDVHWKTRRALLADVSARDRVIEAAFKALDAAERVIDEEDIRHDDCPECDERKQLAVEARRLLAGLEGK